MLDKATKPTGSSNSDTPAAKPPVVIKKYANRRLYNTETSTYVTLDDLAAMVRGERDFVVYDAKTGDDLTHSVLTQIIVEQESRMGTETLLPVPFLQQLIRFYGGSMQKMVPSYLQVSLASFAKDQERLAQQFGTALTPAGAFEAFQDQARKNVALFEQAMNQAMTMFGTFVPPPGSMTGGASAPGPATAEAPAAPVATVATAATRPRPEAVKPEAVKPETPKPPTSERKDDLAEMRAQMATMQAMIEKLSQRT